MKQQFEPKFFAGFWRGFFPHEGLLPDDGVFELEGHKLHAIDVGFTDTDGISVLDVPDMHLVVAGEVVYGDVHQYLIEANTKPKRENWVKAIELVESLNSHTVIPGHKRPGAVDGVNYLTNSKQYILDFQRFLDDGVMDAKILYGKMMGKYGGRLEGSKGMLFGVVRQRLPHRRRKRFDMKIGTVLRTVSLRASFEGRWIRKQEILLNEAHM